MVAKDGANHVGHKFHIKLKKIKSLQRYAPYCVMQKLSDEIYADKDSSQM